MSALPERLPQYLDLHTHMDDLLDRLLSQEEVEALEQVVFAAHERQTIAWYYQGLKFSLRKEVDTANHPRIRGSLDATTLLPVVYGVSRELWESEAGQQHFLLITKLLDVATNQFGTLAGQVTMYTSMFALYVSRGDKFVQNYFTPDKKAKLHENMLMMLYSLQQVVEYERVLNEVSTSLLPLFAYMNHYYLENREGQPGPVQDFIETMIFYFEKKQELETVLAKIADPIGIMTQLRQMIGMAPLDLPTLVASSPASRKT